MVRISLGLLLILLILTACNAPRISQATATPDIVATQVAVLQTNMPTVTLPLSTETLPLPATTATIEPSLTPAQPTLPPATATLAGTAELKDRLGEPTWTDTLDSGKLFYLFENEGTRVTVENGAMLLSGLQTNGWLGWSLTFARQPQNFYIEATFIPQDCAGNDRYGLVFRAPGDNAGYFFGVSCSGQYDLSAADFTNNTDLDLISASSHAAILAGANQTNRLGVMAEGEKISLYANGKLLQEISDSTFKDKGYFGAFVAAGQTTGFTTRMDEIKLWELP